MNELCHGPHIRVYQDEAGRPCLSADDYELFDMLQDYLAEDCELEFEEFYRTNWPREGDHTIIIVSGITRDQLVDSIQKLDLDEIERIYLLNNEPTKG